MSTVLLITRDDVGGELRSEDDFDEERIALEFVAAAFNRLLGIPRSRQYLRPSIIPNITRNPINPNCYHSSLKGLDLSNLSYYFSDIHRPPNTQGHKTTSPILSDFHLSGKTLTVDIGQSVKILLSSIVFCSYISNVDFQGSVAEAVADTFGPRVN